MAFSRPSARTRTYHVEQLESGARPSDDVTLAVTFWQFGDEPVILHVNTSAVIRDSAQLLCLKPRRQILFFLASMPVDITCEVRFSLS